MQHSQVPSTVVVGIGNIIRSDDGLGVHALRRLQMDPRVPPGAVFIDGGTLGPELVSYVCEASRLLLLDSVNVDKSAGTLIRMTGDELRGLPCGGSVHQLGVADLIATLPLASENAPAVLLLGVQPASTDWGTQLTPEVEAALGPLVEAGIRELMIWSQAD